MDDAHFVRFDSDGASPRAELRAPWLEQEGPEFWDWKTQNTRTCTHILRGRLNEVRGYYNQSEEGERRGLGPRPRSPLPLTGRGHPECLGPRATPRLRFSPVPRAGKSRWGRYWVLSLGFHDDPWWGGARVSHLPEYDWLRHGA